MPNVEWFGIALNVAVIAPRDEPFIPHAGFDATFSRYANGVRAMDGSLASTPTPLALGLNVETSPSWPRDV